MTGLRHFLDVTDLSADELATVLDLAERPIDRSARRCTDAAPR